MNNLHNKIKIVIIQMINQSRIEIIYNQTLLKIYPIINKKIQMKEDYLLKQVIYHKLIKINISQIFKMILMNNEINQLINRINKTINKMEHRIHNFNKTIIRILSLKIIIKMENLKILITIKSNHQETNFRILRIKQINKIKMMRQTILMIIIIMQILISLVILGMIKNNLIKMVKLLKKTKKIKINSMTLGIKMTKNSQTIKLIRIHMAKTQILKQTPQTKVRVQSYLLINITYQIKVKMMLTMIKVIILMTSKIQLVIQKVIKMKNSKEIQVLFQKIKGFLLYLNLLTIINLVNQTLIKKVVIITLMLVIT
ncbi:hypothetical protein ABPG72_015202 [Tetrahymena utriculariae]